MPDTTGPTHFADSKLPDGSLIRTVIYGVATAAKIDAAFDFALERYEDQGQDLSNLTFTVRPVPEKQDA